MRVQFVTPAAGPVDRRSTTFAGVGRRVGIHTGYIGSNYFFKIVGKVAFVMCLHKCVQSEKLHAVIKKHSFFTHCTAQHSLGRQQVFLYAFKIVFAMGPG